MTSQKVLVVEDDWQLRKVMRFVLESHGYEVVDVSSGNQAIEFLKEAAVGLIITDLKMSDGDGFTLSKYLKENYPATPLLICSGYLFESRHKLMSVSDGNLLDRPLIDKPFNVEDFLQVVQESFKKLRAS